MKYKLVAIDMDGTLLNSNNIVSERTKLAINNAKKQGVHIVLSTGRVLKSALGYSKALELNNPIIACNGAIIVDEGANIIYKRPMESSIVKEIARLSMERNIYYHLYNESSFFSHIKVDEVLKFYNEGNEEMDVSFKLFNDIEDIVGDKDLNVYKFIFIDENRKKLIDLRKELDKLDNISTSSSWSNNIEAMGFNVSKGTALLDLSQRLNIEPKEIIAIGDSENDLSMLRFAGLGVAMGNGDEIVKNEAKHITDSNDEDGVAKVIEQFILK